MAILMLRSPPQVGLPARIACASVLARGLLHHVILMPVVQQDTMERGRCQGHAESTVTLALCTGNVRWQPGMCRTQCIQA